MDLPEEVLADILRRVPPRHLAACRRVCADWRATIDARRLVLPHLLPGVPRGAFINVAESLRDTYFFARGGPAIGFDTRLADAPTSWCTSFVDHCNGLLLCEADEGTRFIYNPATRRSAVLPPAPSSGPREVASGAYLVFDPFVSLHHEVLVLPELPGEPQPPEPADSPPPPPFNVGRLFFADARVATAASDRHRRRNRRWGGLAVLGLGGRTAEACETPSERARRGEGHLGAYGVAAVAIRGASVLVRDRKVERQGVRPGRRRRGDGGRHVVGSTVTRLRNGIWSLPAAPSPRRLLAAIAICPLPRWFHRQVVAADGKVCGDKNPRSYQSRRA
ncbi:uncharacterized protein [Triticum aestivum]|uniref:uncharacterized protein n=1 Tax=Triticum aestivum TaxID=4565 RepID=UPI001D00278E|nr:uncharacterized protein LOC123100213 [Triticum aestivum]